MVNSRHTRNRATLRLHASTCPVRGTTAPISYNLFQVTDTLLLVTICLVLYYLHQNAL